MIHRSLTAKVKERLRQMPAVAVIGPRQCGKTTLARSLMEGEKTVYIDLERPSDQAKLQDPEIFLAAHQRDLVCFDEIQRKSELFPVLRSAIDDNRRSGRFLILGSASPELLRQSSETLAGRISYLELSPFLLEEVMNSPKKEDALQRLWLRGGFPNSFLGISDKESFTWREDFIRTFLERDIPGLGIKISSETLRRFWLMCAHSHGQILNSLQIGQSLGLSHTTIRSYAELLAQTFTVRILLPWQTNSRKRLIKSPKLYIRDSGILHALLGIDSFDELLGHPVYGASWEGLVIENVLASFDSSLRAGFYRTSLGTEIDLVIEKGQKRIGIECKASSSPTLGKGFYNAMTDLDLKEAYVVSPIHKRYPISKGVEVISLQELLPQLRKALA